MTTSADDRMARRAVAPGRRVAGAVVKHAALLVVAFVMLYPVLWMTASAFKPEAEIFTDLSIVPHSLDPSNFRLGWYAMRESFSTFFYNSTAIAVLSVIGNLFSCSLAAFAFARLEFPLKRLWFALMMGTLMLPYHVTLIPQYVMFQRVGMVDTWWPLLLPKYLAADAFFIFLMVQFFRGVPREFDEAARIDGCGPFGIYWRIMLPLSTPVLATAAIFSFLWTWNDFFGPMIFLNDIAKYTVPLGLRAFIDATGLSAWGQLFAMSVLSLAPVMLIFFAFQKLIIRGVAASGLKG